MTVREGGFAIENKSISRKHLTIEVAAPKSGDGSKLNTHSNITIEDQNSKVGTLLDGQQIKGQSRVLNGTEHEIRLGTYQYPLRIRRRPIVFSFSFSSKEQKQTDPLTKIRSRLEPLDIKCIIPYVIDATTHVVASKRNTAKGLQALINAKHIVTDQFVDAVIKAATPRQPDDPESLSNLEEDIDTNWPDALHYLPAQSKEPSQRPSALFAPDPQRRDVFHGFTFVFGDRTQFDTLQAPINNGGGKALLFGIQFKRTTPDDLVKYVKNAGEKSPPLTSRGEGRGQIVMVRFRDKDDSENWSIELGDEVARRLDQRLIEQSEFLDAILVNDATMLQKPLSAEDDDEDSAHDNGRQPPQGSGHDQPDAGFTAQEPAKAPVRRTKSRRPITSRFRGFDDGFDASSLAQQGHRLYDESLPDSLTNESPVWQQETLPYIKIPPTVSGDGSRDRRTERATRKRPFSVTEDEEDMLDSMLPAATAMKRRRMQDESGVTSERQADAARLGRPLDYRQPQRDSKSNDLDVLEAARVHRQAEDEAARRNEEALEAAPRVIDIAQLRDLALVETMPLRADFPFGNDQQLNRRGEKRWDDRWNGRKNFKRFRRPSRPGAWSGRSSTVIVGLIEAKKKNYGIGDDYWLDTNGQRALSQTSVQKTGKNLPAPQLRGNVSSQHSDTRNHSEGNATSAAHRGEEDESLSIVTLHHSSSGGTIASNTMARKRPPTAEVTPQSTFKRHKAEATAGAESDESEDELRFRFQRRR
ncbi:MAG: hypothetical protein M1817_000064 [Caeruleum heppii]|nr:MAG: hypothetical protein M1817_000064 [Caeruleum heppii]